MRIALTCLFSLSFCGVTLANNGNNRDNNDDDNKKRVGYASYYHDRFHGRRTASGEVYDKTALTAAHLKLPFGTRVRVTRLDNGKEIIVKINDRGPYSQYMIDLSRAAAAELGLVGIKRKVSLDILDKDGNTTGRINENGDIVTITSENVDPNNPISFNDDQQPPTITAEGELQRSGAGRRAASAAAGNEISDEAPARGRGKRGRHARGGRHHGGKHHARGGRGHARGHKAHRGGGHKGGHKKARGGKRRRR